MAEASTVGGDAAWRRQGAEVLAQCGARDMAEPGLASFGGWICGGGAGSSDGDAREGMKVGAGAWEGGMVRWSDS